MATKNNTKPDKKIPKNKENFTFSKFMGLRNFDYKNIDQKSSEIIRLQYDKISKLMSVGTASLVGNAAITVALHQNSPHFMFRVFLILSIYSLLSVLFLTIQFNILHNALLDKIK